MLHNVISGHAYRSTLDVPKFDVPNPIMYRSFFVELALYYIIEFINKKNLDVPKSSIYRSFEPKRRLRYIESRLYF